MKTLIDKTAETLRENPVKDKEAVHNLISSLELGINNDMPKRNVSARPKPL